MTIEQLYSLFLQNPKICTDSRNIFPGSIFFALKGENFNANQFAKQAINQGCSYAIIDEKDFFANERCILVKDVLTTLQELAKHHRTQLNIPIIGITGTNGKTTSKELIYAVLSTEKNVYATKGNLNNHIGVPISVLEINDSHEIAVIEMGANHKNEISFLCNIAQPNYGIITNIGTAHIEGFGSLQGVIDAKTELYQFIQQNNGMLFVNSDDNLLLNLSKKIQQVSYGNNGMTKVSLTCSDTYAHVQYKNLLIQSHLIGDYQLNNIALAISVGKYFGLADKNIKLGIEKYIPSNNRSQILKTKNNLLIMDAYNANPSSMQAMLESFAKQHYDHKICILGDMLELGDISLQEHQKIVELTHKLNLKSIFIGKNFAQIEKDAFENTTAFLSYLKKHPISQHSILLKGSRGIALEKLVPLL